MRLQGIGHIPYSREDPYYREVCEYLGVYDGSIATKEEIYRTLGYIPLPTIEKMHRSRATHRVVAGGNRSGKSQGGTWEVLPYLFWNSRGWVVSANYDLAEIIMDKIMLLLVERANLTRVRRADQMEEFTFYYASHEHTLFMWAGATLQAKSAENPDSMHGHALDYVVIDEASLFPYSLYDTRLVPRLVDSGGWILSLGTFEPLQGEWFEEFFDIGQMENDLDIESWCHPTEDNYHLYVAHGGETPVDVARVYWENPRKIARDNPDAVWPLRPGEQVIIYNVDLNWLEKEKERIPKPVFQARYEAIQAANQFVVFPEWKVSEFAGKEARRRTRFDEDQPVYLAIDPGGTYAVLAIQLKQFPEESYENQIAKGYHICIIDTLYFQTTVTTQEVFEAMKLRPWWPNVSRDVEWWDSFQGVIDVRAKEQQRAFRNLARDDETIDHLHLRGRNVYEDDGIKTLQHYLDTRTLWSHPSNKYLHLEFRRYHWSEATIARLDVQDPRKGRKPVNEWNHLLKALWYFLVVKFGCYGRSSSSATVTLEELRRLA